MLKTYIKIAINSLRKNPLYTSVSLFGISFTLMVLMFTTAVLQNELGSHQPMSNVNNLLFINGLKGIGYERVIKIKIDSTYKNGKLHLDSIKKEEINYANTNSESNSGLSMNLFKEKVKPMKTIENATAYIPGVFIQTWRENKKLQISGSYVDENYWKIFDFIFLEGKPFYKNTVENSVREIVITDKMAKEYFGKMDSYLNQYFDWGTNGKFKVIGVVQTPNSSVDVIRADLFLPLTLANKGNLDYDWGYFGGLQAVLEKGSNTARSQVDSELKKVGKNLQPKDDLDVYSMETKTNADNYGLKFMGNNSTENLGQKFLTYVGASILFFLLVPLLNLIHLNNSRVIERAGEIGVRKAFGAETSDVFYQFLFENFIITFIGGMLGILMSIGLLQIFNYNEWLGKTHLTMDYKVLLYSLFIIIIFSILSGVIPAIRIAQFNIVKALKHSNL